MDEDSKIAISIGIFLFVCGTTIVFFAFRRNEIREHNQRFLDTV